MPGVFVVLATVCACSVWHNKRMQHQAFILMHPYGSALHPENSWTCTHSFVVYDLHHGAVIMLIPCKDLQAVDIVTVWLMCSYNEPAYHASCD